MKTGELYKHNIDGTQYKLIDFNPFMDTYKLQTVYTAALNYMFTVNFNDLMTNYTKISNDDQLDLFGGYDWLEKKDENKKKECIHDWKVYNGLNFSDEYCITCGEKREIKPK